MTEKETEFCRRFTALLHEFGYGINEEAIIYELEYGPSGDEGREASIDENGRLQFV